METANICGVRVKDARKKKNLAQVELSAALEIEYGIDLTQSDISEIERQVRSVKDYELDALAQILGVSVIWLLRG